MCYITVASALLLLTAIVALFGYVLWHGAHLDEMQRLHAQELDIDAVADGKAVVELGEAVGSGLIVQDADADGDADAAAERKAVPSP